MADRPLNFVALQPSRGFAPRLRLHRPRAEFDAIGRSLRDSCPRESHAVWQPPPDRHDPLHLLEQSGRDRIPELLPIRHGRMLQSPFAYFRGAALPMAADLAATPATGLTVQACGDCHLANFGAFATPERRIIFDINDLDETLPAPWEWDLKRLTASFLIAARHNGLSEDSARDVVASCARSYREHMRELGKMCLLDIWYASLDVEKLLPRIRDKESRTRLRKRLRKARDRKVLEHDFPQLVCTAGATPRIKDDPPLTYHVDHFSVTSESVQEAFAQYRQSLPPTRRQLLDQFELVDLAIKVVGVGSVGTICGIALLMAGADDPLFLQVKQARPSVLEGFAGRSPYSNHGERVVMGHQLMQSASDLFLGWTSARSGRHYYVRQLRDMKLKPRIEEYSASAMREYGELCGWTLARAHARCGEPAKISGYLGKSDRFDRALVEFSVAYADQNERDYECLLQAARSGKLEVAPESAPG